MFKQSPALIAILVCLSAMIAGSVPPAQTIPPNSNPQGEDGEDRLLALRPTNLSKPLWPGSRFTELDRRHAMARGLKYIYRTSLKPRSFAAHYGDYLFLFYTLSAAMSDPDLKAMAHGMGVERARAWRHLHPALPNNANAYAISDYAFASADADDLGVTDPQMKEQIRSAAKRFSARDYLLFDPLTEPPPGDIPQSCENDGAANPQGSKFCHFCKHRLKMRTRYDIWCDALVMTYTGEHYGIDFGARYADVLKWAPALRPYRGNEHGRNPEFYDSVFAVTHIIYTLNNYSQFRLAPALLPHEYQFLRDNFHEVMSERDADMIGEFMDTLKSFGLTSLDPDVRRGIEYFLRHQNRDGSWGSMDIPNRYHQTWNGIGALSEYNWPAGEGINFPEVRPLLQSWGGGSQ